MLLLAACAVALSGCSAAKSAMGVLAPKPTQVTVINHVPAPVVVAAPVAPPKVEARKRPWTAIAIGAAAGAGVGALVGITGAHPVGTSAAIGASVGAVGGLVAHELAD